MVRLYLQTGYSLVLLSELFGASTHSIKRWVAACRRQREQGLQPKIRVTRKKRVASQICKQVVAIKIQHPAYGPRRIADILKRFLAVGASPSTVQRTLKFQGLTHPAKKKPKKNPAKPRFFEHTRPNQLWQSDILIFRLTGKNAYLIGYMDGYSRYITGCGLYRS